MEAQVAITIPSLKEIELDNLIKHLLIEAKGNEPETMMSAFENLCNFNRDQILNMTFADADNVYQAIQKSLNEKTELRKSFDIDGVTYGMIPNLQKVKLGEFADMDGLLKPLFEGKILHEEALRFMTALFRPITKGDVKTLYAVEEYQGSDSFDTMKKAPADVYLNSIAFFLTLKTELLNNSLVYSLREMKKVKKDKATLDILRKNGLNFQTAGDGLVQLITSQITILQNGMQSLTYHLPPLSSTLQWRKN